MERYESINENGKTGKYLIFGGFNTTSTNRQQRLTKRKTYRRGRGQRGAQRVWCKRPVPKKIKFFKKKKSKKSKIRISSCVRERESEKFVYFQMCDAIKYQMMPFKPIFSPVERTKLKNGIVTRLMQNKRSDGLKNGFLLF